MKKLVFLISFLVLSFISYSQSGYGGLIVDKNANLAGVRPYINSVLMERDFIGNSTYTSLIGAGMNSLGNISVSFGFDIHRPLSYENDINLIYGGSIELMGMEEVYQSFVPNFRLGIENRKWILFATNNYIFKQFTYRGEHGYHPNMRPTIGLFYKFIR